MTRFAQSAAAFALFVTTVNAFAAGATTPEVPEPGTWLMLLTGLLFLAGGMRRKQSMKLEQIKQTSSRH